MKTLFVILAICTFLCVGCTQQDAIDTWTKNIYPSADGVYDVGSPLLQYDDGYFTNLWVSQNVSATYFIGDGSQLTGLEQGELILYFLNSDSPDIVGAKRLSSNYNVSEVILTGAGLADGNTLMGTWITDIGVPAKDLLIGNFRVHVAGKKTGGTKNVQFYYEIYRCNAAGAELGLLSTSEYTNVLTATRTDYRIWAIIDEINISTSDRIKVKGYAFVSGSGSAPSVEAYIQGASNTRLVVPVGGISVEKFVPYTGAVNNLVIGGAIIRTDGTIQPASMANASAPNNSIFYSAGSNKLCYKDSTGNVHELY